MNERDYLKIPTVNLSNGRVMIGRYPEEGECSSVVQVYAELDTERDADIYLELLKKYHRLKDRYELLLNGKGEYDEES